MSITDTDSDGSRTYNQKNVLTKKKLREQCYEGQRLLSFSIMCVKERINFTINFFSMLQEINKRKVHFHIHLIERFNDYT